MSLKIRKIGSDFALGTARMGTLRASRKTVIELFGEPNALPTEKTNYEWTLDIGGVIVTIYDYKTPNVPEDVVIDWSIGSTIYLAQEVVRRVVAGRGVDAEVTA